MLKYQESFCPTKANNENGAFLHSFTFFSCISRCITDYLKHSSFQNKTLTVSVDLGLKSRHYLARCLWLKVTLEEHSSCCPGLQSPLNAPPRGWPLSKLPCLAVGRVWSFIGLRSSRVIGCRPLCSLPHKPMWRAATCNRLIQVSRGEKAKESTQGGSHSLSIT